MNVQKINPEPSHTEYKQRLRIHVESMKHRIAALGSRLRRYHKKIKRYKDNNLFSNNQRKFFRQFSGTSHPNKQTSAPNLDEVSEYYSNI